MIYNNPFLALSEIISPFAIQIFFIAMIALLLMAVNRILATRSNWRAPCLLAARTATIYVMGAASMYWMIDRGLTLFEATFRGVY